MNEFACSHSVGIPTLLWMDFFLYKVGCLSVIVGYVLIISPYYSYIVDIPSLFSPSH